MCLHLSAQTGTEITPAQLLGTEGEEKAERIQDAQKSLQKLERKMKKAGLAQ